MKINSGVIKPVLTEKATNLATQKVYMFYIQKKATKHMVKQILEDLYQVKVDKVTVVSRKGKTRRAGKRMVTKILPNKKIAYVKVKEGKIDLFPQI